MDLIHQLADTMSSLGVWHWLALGAILLAIEIASTTSYLLWPGIAALLVGGLKLVIPGMSGPLSVFLFAVLAVVSTVVWKRSPLGRITPTSHEHLNARMRTYLGRRGAAAQDFVGGHGAILLDDTRWSAVISDDTAPRKGEMLHVVGADGTVLKVRLES